MYDGDRSETVAVERMRKAKTTADNGGGSGLVVATGIAQAEMREWRWWG